MNENEKNGSKWETPILTVLRLYLGPRSHIFVNACSVHTYLPKTHIDRNRKFLALSRTSRNFWNAVIATIKMSTGIRIVSIITNDSVPMLTILWPQKSSNVPQYKAYQIYCMRWSWWQGRRCTWSGAWHACMVLRFWCRNQNKLAGFTLRGTLTLYVWIALHFATKLNYIASCTRM